MNRPPSPRPRARAVGLDLGPRPTGPRNAITDVAGVGVGHVTRWEGDDVRTGVTAILPADVGDLYARPMAASMAVLNGAGELTGSLQLREWGVLETPVLLTSTMAVGRVYDATVDHLIEAVPEVGTEDVVIPVVGECDDGWLDAVWRRSVTVADGREALRRAEGGVGRDVVEGVVGAGTGMVCFGRKGGIGTASRQVADGTVGVLLLTNFGSPHQLIVQGRPVDVTDVVGRARDAGSCIGVVATDLPLDRHQLGRVAARVGLGLARTGAVANHGSGDIACAFSTSMRYLRSRGWSTTAVPDTVLDVVFEAVVTATEEAVLNSLLVADTVEGRSGHVAPGLVL